ncbi:MAG: hypothetical protein VX264_02460, partial [Chloroflexota bacterium]|nr:hypothetical protein [Chloroflexota bacterium]
SLGFFIASSIIAFIAAWTRSIVSPFAISVPPRHSIFLFACTFDEGIIHRIPISSSSLFWVAWSYKVTENQSNISPLPRVIYGVYDNERGREES